MRQSHARVYAICSIDASDIYGTMHDGHTVADKILCRIMQDRPARLSKMLAMHLGSPDGLDL